MLIYSLTGVLFGLAAVMLFKLCMTKGLKGAKFAGAYALLLAGALGIGFSLDWGYASVVEGEPQSAAIGFLVFGGIGIVLTLVGLRIAFHKNKASKTPVVNEAA